MGKVISFINLKGGVGKTTTPTRSSTNKSNLDDLKQLVSSIENLQNKYNKLNININISIKIYGSNKVSNENKILLLNPVTAFRDMGKDALKEKLITHSLEDLVKITKTYTPDFSGKIYKKEDVNLIIEYIIERASSLSKMGQVFRNISNPK